MTCGPSIGNVWPLPRSISALSLRTTSRIDPYALDIRTNNFQEYPANEYWNLAMNRFNEMQRSKLPQGVWGLSVNRYLTINVTVASDNMRHDLNTIEDYSLFLTPLPDSSEIIALIGAHNFYGARNALETLSQLMVYDDFNNAFVILDSIGMTDSPTFRHRGISLDTSRNFYPVEDIKKTIDGMAMVKLNTFHWHITDSQSFPMYVEAQPSLSRIGAYSPKEVYSREDMKEITTYARARGVRVVPEFDQPAHVGEGWQFRDMLTCFNAMPWSNYCYQPPCGQFDPSVAELYDVLEDIYREIVENFEPTLFHMGADEVTSSCWNSSARLQQYMIARGWDINLESSFMTLWGEFQRSVEERFDRVTNETIPIILWSSTLTAQPNLLQYLNASRHIIQWWGNSETDIAEVQHLIQNGFRIIFSNVDRLYLDCGFSGWTSDGLNWCAPYKNWQGIYDNLLVTLVGGPQNIHLALGAEVTIWSEQIDPMNLDSRLWPRAAALAERLWRSKNF